MACPRCASLLRDADDGRACVSGCGVFLDRADADKVVERAVDAGLTGLP